MDESNNCDKQNKLDFFAKYYQDLQAAYDSSEICVRYNKDRAHNSIVMCFILDKSKTINIYCGKMSVFRNNFYRRIDAEHEKDNVGLGRQLKSEFEKRLRKFLSAEDSVLRIIAETKIESFDDFLCNEELKNALEQNKLDLFYLPEESELVGFFTHFSFSDDSNLYRFEDDMENHSALCCFNDIKTIEEYQNNYYTLMSYAEQADTNAIINQPRSVAC